MRAWSRLLSGLVLSSAAGTAAAQAFTQEKLPDIEPVAVQRQRAFLKSPPPLVGVRVDRAGLSGDLLDAGQATEEAPHGVLFGSLGRSSWWHKLPGRIERVEIRRVGSEHSLFVYNNTTAAVVEMSLVGRSRNWIEMSLPVTGENEGFMKYSVWAVRLRPGDYEVVGLWSLTDKSAFTLTGGEIDRQVFNHTRDGQSLFHGLGVIEARQLTPIPFRIEVGKATYLGRLTFVPLTLKTTAEQESHHARDMTWLDAGRTYFVGFKVWVQDAEAADLRLAALPQERASLKLHDLLLTAPSNLFVPKVAPELLDHRIGDESFGPAGQR